MPEFSGPMHISSDSPSHRSGPKSPQHAAAQLGVPVALPARSEPFAITISGRNQMLRSVAIRGSLSGVFVETYLLDESDTVPDFAARALSRFSPEAESDRIDQISAKAISVETALSIDNVTYPGMEITHRDFVVRSAAIDNTRLVAVCSLSGPSPELTWTRS